MILPWITGLEDLDKDVERQNRFNARMALFCNEYLTDSYKKKLAKKYLKIGYITLEEYKLFNTNYAV